jgi:hypothetical protein
MLPLIHHSISEARKQLHADHQDIRTERTMNATLTTATATNPITDRIGPH